MAGDCPVEEPRGLQAQQKGSKSAGKWKKLNVVKYHFFT